ncbi:MAG: PKD domain-containing protein, partial [Flavobacteriales bacterium]|nr:PKD domain-containing protein [Flavobacteriales bacterium]
NSSFTFNNECLYDSIQFVNTSPTISGTIAYFWDFGDGSTTNVKDTNHFYGAPGIYTVQLDLTSDFGCASTSTNVVEIYPVPTANFSFTDECDETSVNFLNSSSISTGTLSNSWDFNDATTSSLIDVVHLFPSDGTYSVALIVESDKGCLDTVVKTTTIHPLPRPNFTFDIACDGAPTAFANSTTISGGSITNYLWDFGDGSNSIVSDPIYQYLNAGTYAVNLTATSNLLCINDTTINVVVSTFPLADFSVNNECFGDAINCFNNSSISVGTLSYQWEFGDDSTSVATNPSHVYLGAGTYPIKVIAYSNLGCVDSVTKYVTIYQLPIVEAGIDTSISEGFNVQLYGSAIGASTFNWSPLDELNNNTIYNPIASPLDTTIYFLTVTDLNGCSNYDSVTVNVIEDFRLFIYNVITPDGNGQNDTWKIANIETFNSADVSIF